MRCDEILTLDQFHHERRDATAFFKAVDAADVRMIQRRERLRFTLKAGDPLGISDERVRQDLDRHVAIQRRVARSVDLAHAAGPEGGEDLVRAEAGAGAEGQTVGLYGRSASAGQLSIKAATSTVPAEVTGDTDLQRPSIPSLPACCIGTHRDEVASRPYSSSLPVLPSTLVRIHRVETWMAGGPS